MVERDDTVATNDNADLSGKNFTCPITPKSENAEKIEVTILPNATREKSQENDKFDWSEEQIGYVTLGSE